MPYLASSFSAPAGYDSVPLSAGRAALLAPLTLLPREVVWAGWLAVVIAAGCSRCGAWVPWIAVVPILAWPPFAEGLLGGNVQVVLVAAFVAVYVPGSSPRVGRRPMRATARWPRSSDVQDHAAHAWFALLRDPPESGRSRPVVVAGVVAGTIPLVGTQLWFDWVDQVKRAADPPGPSPARR